MYARPVEPDNDKWAWHVYNGPGLFSITPDGVVYLLTIVPEQTCTVQVDRLNGSAPGPVFKANLCTRTVIDEHGGSGAANSRE